MNRALISLMHMGISSTDSKGGDSSHRKALPRTGFNLSVHINKYFDRVQSLQLESLSTQVAYFN